MRLEDILNFEIGLALMNMINLIAFRRKRYETTLLNPLFVVVRGASIIFLVKTCIVAAIVQTLIKFDFFPFGKSMTSYFQLKYN